MVNLREHIANALLIGVIQGGESDHAPLVNELRHSGVQPSEAWTRAAVQLSRQRGRLREQVAVQRRLRAQPSSSLCEL